MICAENEDLLNESKAMDDPETDEPEISARRRQIQTTHTQFVFCFDRFVTACIYHVLSDINTPSRKRKTDEKSLIVRFFFFFSCEFNTHMCVGCGFGFMHRKR